MTWLTSDLDLALLLAAAGLPWLLGAGLLLTWAAWGAVAVLRGLWRGARWLLRRPPDAPPPDAPPPDAEDLLLAALADGGMPRLAARGLLARVTDSRCVRLGHHDPDPTLTTELPRPTGPDDPTLAIHVPETRHA